MAGLTHFEGDVTATFVISRPKETEPLERHLPRARHRQLLIINGEDIPPAAATAPSRR